MIRFQEDLVYYRVQVGGFKEKLNSETLYNELNNQGFPVFIIYEDECYKVQVGAYSYLHNAVEMEKKLRMKGYSTFITT